MAEASYGPLVGALIDAVASESGFNMGEFVASVDYHPPVDADLTLRLVQDHPDLAVASRHVISAERVGIFLNLKLNASLGELRRPACAPARRFAVEHTSLVPAYPINLATLRSSVIGDFVRRSLSLGGHEARSHFWVQDTARQMDLVLPSWSRNTTGKADHIAGKCFACGLHGADAFDPAVAEWCSKMFPLSATNWRQPELSRGAAEEATAMIGRICTGWLDTFRAFSIAAPEFDVDSALETGLPGWEEVMSVARAELARDPSLMQPRNETGSHSYLERSILYYAYLLSRYDQVYSVVPSRQMVLCESARVGAATAMGKPPEVIQLRSYADVLIDGKRDSVRERRFHSVDGYLADGEALGLSQADIRHGLVARFLSSRSTTTIHLKRLTWHALGGRAPGHQIPSNHSVGGLLLEDELSVLLDRALRYADFASVMLWKVDAEKLLNDHSDRLIAGVRAALRRAVDQFSV